MITTLERTLLVSPVSPCDTRGEGLLLKALCDTISRRSLQNPGFENCAHALRGLDTKPAPIERVSYDNTQFPAGLFIIQGADAVHPDPALKMRARVQVITAPMAWSNVTPPRPSSARRATRSPGSPGRSRPRRSGWCWKGRH